MLPGYETGPRPARGRMYFRCMTERSGPAAMRNLQVACRACHVCVEEGIIPEANPTFAGESGAPFFLVGQAPGPAERQTRRPFSGRAGKELDRWMLRAGFASAEEFRHLTYIAALMRCFPGRNRTGTGDLWPPPAAVKNCAHWLDAELGLLQPQVIILVGQMAIARFLGPGPLEERVSPAPRTSPGADQKAARELATGSKGDARASIR
ncbi:MAG: hypothetical protein E6I73_14550 [Chloroflexi bacterium]|nr:MAG: hypothetical protein E6I73_14550 [Chloroflexota bacterium]